VEGEAKRGWRATRRSGDGRRHGRAAGCLRAEQRPPGLRGVWTFLEHHGAARPPARASLLARGFRARRRLPSRRNGDFWVRHDHEDTSASCSICATSRQAGGNRGFVGAGCRAVSLGHCPRARCCPVALRLSRNRGT
jgi:hypothetical protein